jgi:hypothetical protein
MNTLGLRILLGFGVTLIPLGAAGISPSKLEINLGPFPVDRYLDPSANGGIIPACGNPGWSVRDCVKNMFNNNPSSPPYSSNNYVAQGVTGVRFFYTLGGGFYSRPFNSDGSLNGTWLNNLAAFLADLRSYGIQRITPTAVLTGNWSGSSTGIPLVARSVVSCGVPKTLYFYPWMPFGLRDV